MTKNTIALWLIALAWGCSPAGDGHDSELPRGDAGAEPPSDSAIVDCVRKDDFAAVANGISDATGDEAKVRVRPAEVVPVVDARIEAIRDTVSFGQGDSSDMTSGSTGGNDALATETKRSDATSDGRMDSLWSLDAGTRIDLSFGLNDAPGADVLVDVAGNDQAGMDQDAAQREAGRQTYPYDVDLIVNGRLALGSFYWQFNTAGSGAGDLSTTAGEAAVTIRQAGEEAWHVQFVQGGFRLIKGYAYTLSFDVWADRATSFMANINQDREPYASYSGERIIAATSLRRRETVEFFMTDESDDDVRLTFDLGRSAGTVHLDNIRMTILSVEDEAGARVQPMQNPGGFVRVVPCAPAKDADAAVISDIRSAAARLWSKASSAEADIETATWAGMFFATEGDFSDFLINWANVETGGHFNARHENWSRNDTEQNLGVFQINQTWAVRHDTFGWHDSNPHEYPSEDAFDTLRCVDWALHHLLGFGPSAGWNLTKMLDGYWHGTLNDPSPYADGVYGGHIIDYPE